jgi:hypothetical protein
MSVYTASGNYELTKLVLRTEDSSPDNNTGLFWDLRPFLAEASLFESIENVAMSGYVAIVESFNISDVLPLYGNEIVEMEFVTAGSDHAVKYSGRVYKITDRHRISEHASGYVIKFVSEASILSQRKFVNRGFKSTIGEIVDSVYRTKLSGSVQKPLRVEKTRGIHTYTIGEQKPLEAIMWLSRQAKSSTGNSGYVFFENHSEFVFASLESMYEQEPVAHYNNKHSGVYSDVKKRHEEEFGRIQDVDMFEENSILDRYMEGFHGSEHMYFDIVEKRIVNYKFDNEKEFKPEKSLGDIVNKKPVETGRDLIRFRYVGDSTYTYDETLNIMKIKQSEMFKGRIVVFGDSKLLAGDIIEVDFPNWSSHQKEAKSAYSGKVLISGIRHLLTQTSYSQNLLVRKDAYKDVNA